MLLKLKVIKLTTLMGRINSSSSMGHHILISNNNNLDNSVMLLMELHTIELPILQMQPQLMIWWTSVKHPHKPNSLTIIIKLKVTVTLFQLNQLNHHNQPRQLNITMSRNNRNSIQGTIKAYDLTNRVVIKQLCMLCLSIWRNINLPSSIKNWFKVLHR